MSDKKNVSFQEFAEMYAAWKKFNGEDDGSGSPPLMSVSVQPPPQNDPPPPNTPRPIVARRGRPATVDHEEVIADYLTGQYTQAMLARKYGVSQPAISYHIRTDDRTNPNPDTHNVSVKPTEYLGHRIIRR